MSIERILSGGQTGADRAALDVAIQLGIPHGGWVPRGRRTEEGPLPEKYRLQEMETDSYPARTEKNVVASDGTLIVSHGDLTGGSARTRDLAETHARPWLHMDMDAETFEGAVESVRAWIAGNRIGTLNVAGPRASEDQSIYRETHGLLVAILGERGA